MAASVTAQSTVRPDTAGLTTGESLTMAMVASAGVDSVACTAAATGARTAALSTVMVNPSAASGAIAVAAALPDTGSTNPSSKPGPPARQASDTAVTASGTCRSRPITGATDRTVVPSIVTAPSTGATAVCWAMPDREAARVA